MLIYKLKKLSIISLFCCYCLLVLFSIFNYSSRVNYTQLIKLLEQKINNKLGCKINYASLGPANINLEQKYNLSELNFASLSPGGYRKPDCFPLQKVAIIIPYRDRLFHLALLLQRLHEMLDKQNSYYQIFTIEQKDENAFNRGRLLNIGVIESLKFDDFDCFIFHDVDLIPEDDRNLYYCSDTVHHLVSSIDENRYHIMYYNYLGGVVAVSKSNIFKTNGHSNIYWGWGNEDDDFSARVMELELTITRPPENIGRYKMIRHIKKYRSSSMHNLFLTWRSRWRWDGLNSFQSLSSNLTSDRLLRKRRLYSLLSATNHCLYTNISVAFPPPDEEELLRLEGAEEENFVWFLRFYFP